MLRKLTKRLFQVREKKNRTKPFYQLTSTCQIPKLDMIYRQYFGECTDGCFIEVGAFDGEYTSNTSCLSDLGWSGFYIEPVPEYYKKCKNRHLKNKNITVSQYAIGANFGKAEIKIGGPLSTIDDKMVKNFLSLSWANSSFSSNKKLIVDQIPLNAYIEKKKIIEGFELLVVDVEGYELNVLKGFDIGKWRPQMVIIELHDQNDDYLLIRDECNQIVRYFDEYDYKVIYKDFTNTIYVSKS